MCYESNLQHFSCTVIKLNYALVRLAYAMITAFLFVCILRFLLCINACEILERGLMPAFYRVDCLGNN